MEQGCLDPMAQLLHVNDPKVVSVILDGLKNILKSGARVEDNTGVPNPYTMLLDELGGIDQIENLQSHDNNDIYLKAVGILEEFFGEEDEDDENMTPNVQAEQFAFGVSKPGEAAPELELAGEAAGAGMGAAAFDEGRLGELLGAQHPLKLVFDCRGDADALHHQFGVRMRGVFDVQVAFCLKKDKDHGGKRGAYLMGLRKALKECPGLVDEARHELDRV